MLTARPRQPSRTGTRRSACSATVLGLIDEYQRGRCGGADAQEAKEQRRRARCGALPEHSVLASPWRRGRRLEHDPRTSADRRPRLFTCAPRERPCKRFAPFSPSTAFA